MTFDTQNYIELFYQDAEEHLQLMTDALLDLENNPADREALSALFRSAHTMKSSSAMVGFMHISEFTHRMEDLIGFLRDQEIAINTEMVNILFQSFDVLKDMLTQLQDGAAESHRNETKRKANDLIQTFNQFLTNDQPAGSDATPHDTGPIRVRLTEETRNRVEEMRLSGEKIHEILVRFGADVQMASARAFLIISNLNKIGTIVQTVPALEDDEQDLGLELAAIFAGSASENEIRNAVEVSEVESVSIRDVTEIDQFEWRDFGQQSDTHPSALVDRTHEGACPEREEKVETSFERREDRSKMQTVRVSIDKLDRLLNLAAEMVIQRGRAYELGQRIVAKAGKGGVEEEMLDAVVQQGMFLTQLQETIMEARMVPIGTVFSRFKRVVRDLAHTRGKNVNLVMEGEETELDKKIIDQVGDPLMHMVRNAVDHGIESPGERSKLGKPKEGLLYLNAIHQGNNIVITVRDDGKGLNPELIKKKAVEKGIVTVDESASMSKKEILSLIFKPGFSTAEQVTDLSGRGVGMDVVRRSIESLGGSVEIESEVGVGTTFVIKLPLTLAIIQALLVEAGHETYALPISNVSETIRIDREEIFSVKGQGKVFRLRDCVVPILNLKNVVTNRHDQDTDDRCYVAVLRNGQNYVGLIVDRMVNEQEIVIKSLGGSISEAPYIAGAAILGNGQVILILDTASLIEQTLGSAA